MQASNRFHTSAARTTWRRCPHSRSRRLQVSSSHPMACCDSLHVSHFWNRWRIERQLFFVAFFKQSFAGRYSRCRRCQAYRLSVEDPIFVVLSRRHSQDGQHRSWISSSCGEIILYQQDSLFFSATDFPSLEVGFTSDYLTWELDAVFSFKTPATDLTVPMRSEFELCAFNCHHQTVVCIRTQYNKTLIGSLRHWLSSSLVLISPPHIPIILFFLPASASSTWFEGCYLDWNGCKRRSKKSWCWMIGEDDSILQEWNCLSSTCLRVGFWYEHIWFGIFWSIMILSNNQSRATLWVRGHVSRRRTSAFNDQVDHCFAVFKNVKQAPKWEGFAFVTTWSTLTNSRSTRFMSFFISVLVCFLLGFVAQQVSLYWLISGRMQYFNNQIPEIESGNTIHAQTSIQRNDFRFSRTVRKGSLFQTHPTCGNECSTSEDTQIFPRCWFRIYKVPSKVWDLEQSHSTMLCSITHLAILSVIALILNVRDQTNQAFFTSSCPFLWRLVPVCLRTIECRVHQFVQNRGISGRVRAHFLQFSNRFQFFIFEDMIIQAWNRDFILLLNVFMRRFTKSVHAFLRMTFHAVRPSDGFRDRLFPTRWLFSCSSGDSWFEHLFVFLNDTFIRFAFTLIVSQVHVVKKWCRFSQVNQFHQFLRHKIEVFPSFSHFDVIHVYRQE